MCDACLRMRVSPSLESCSLCGFSRPWCHPKECKKTPKCVCSVRQSQPCCTTSRILRAMRLGRTATSVVSGRASSYAHHSILQPDFIIQTCSRCFVWDTSVGKKGQTVRADALPLVVIRPPLVVCLPCLLALLQQITTHRPHHRAAMACPEPQQIRNMPFACMAHHIPTSQPAAKLSQRVWCPWPSHPADCPTLHAHWLKEPYPSQPLNGQGTLV